ncbi:hypothetical protein BDR03DRAFT_1002803 [Suillus americanus]|nr:hypothetical protein BDR03DRAFT_1002803 [Suillus americanus]
MEFYLLRWALYVETGQDVGNTYEIVGEQDSYTFRMTENQPLENKDRCGGCYVGRLNSDTELALMGDILKKVEVFQNNLAWNSHDWVETALTTLGDSGFSIHMEEWIRAEPWCLQDIMLQLSYLSVANISNVSGARSSGCCKEWRKREIEGSACGG